MADYLLFLTNLAKAATPVITDHTTEYLSFWAKVISAISWPISAIVLALLFRPQILSLLEKLTQVEGLGIKASFAERVERLAEDSQTEAPEAEKRSEGAQANKANSGEQAPDSQDEADIAAKPDFSIVGMSPEAVVLMGWRDIEMALRRVASANDVELRKGVGGLTVAKTLLDRGLISARTLKLVREAVQLRNAVAHGRPVSVSFTESIAYLHSARTIARAVVEEAGS